jgi:hypothetical protein
VNRFVPALSTVLRAGWWRYHVSYANPARVVSREHLSEAPARNAADRAAALVD